ncbi:hypothetical protein LJ737_06575 [Hymenobacter sp. 15J16-1T3B]|uniref:hypothetical protein n=1 Tax=Hymenobacter sp. 15J16-1T3B TaxID=2886941 RepID=UPI001D116B58|nr:hypothetical protein [Hymenobacter sp. 15J16-1T3B]MCC3156893.1 hypothetical protein [Hymenobacter sp. 15J16-1T3B]
MNATVLTRLVSLVLFVALLLPSLDAAASIPANFGRHGRAGVHRPVYASYKKPVYKKGRTSLQLAFWKR